MEVYSAEAVGLISKPGFMDHVYAYIVLDITRLASLPSAAILDIFKEVRKLLQIMFPRMR